MAIVGRGMKKAMGGVGVMGVGMGVIDGAWTYHDRRTQNPDESKGTSMAMAGLDAALWTFLPAVAWGKLGYDMAKTAGEAGMFNTQGYESRAIARNDVGASWNYQDTEQAATMRQRGLQAIQSGRMSARSALGGEARALHRGAL
jgi:hypothetical protein